MENILIYGDESSVNNKDLSYMGIGTLFCNKIKRNQIKKDIILLQKRFNNYKEIKWRNVDNSNIPFYKALIDYFINSELSFYWMRIVKEHIDLEQYHSNNVDTALYKRYYFLLKDRLQSNINYYIFLDKRTTKEKNKLIELDKFLSIQKQTSWKNYNIKKIEEYPSKNHLLIQLTDFLIGSICYEFNKKDRLHNKWKEEIIHYLEKKLWKSLLSCSTITETKFNLFCIELWLKR